MKTLKPIYDFDKYSMPIANEIYAKLYYEIFKPLFDILEVTKTRQNASTTSLINALKTGKLRYEGGAFVGNLNASLSKQLRAIGATYNKTKKAYTLPQINIPPEIKVAISEGNSKSKDQIKKIEDYLRAIEGREMKLASVEPIFGTTIKGLNTQFSTSVKKVTSKDVEIPLEPHLMERLKQEYTDNIEEYVSDWSKDQVLRLKQKVQENVIQGYRAENLIKDIIAERGVSYRKAKFLAKQETSLMVSKYRQIRYEEVGINNYQWSTSRDNRVRHDHRELNGKVFSFSQPPIVDKHTGKRANPGEDYNCRCVAIPIIKTAELMRGEYAER